MSTSEKKVVLTFNEKKDLEAYCKLNNLEEDKVIKECYIKGFNIERYGLLSGSVEVQEPKIEIIEKEVVKYIEKPIEIITEKEVIKYIEIPVEVIKEVEVVKEVMVPPVEIKVTEYVDREVIREVPVEKIVNVSDNTQIDYLMNKIKELENREPEKIEMVKEIPVEKEVVKEVVVHDNTKIEMLTGTLQKLKQDLGEKNKKIEELEKIISNFEKYKQSTGAAYLRGSNLNDTLYK